MSTFPEQFRLDGRTARVTGSGRGLGWEMARGLAEVDWEDITEYAPAVVTAIAMPLTYSIATGIGLGFITYVLAKIIAGKITEAKPAVVILALIFAAKFAITG